MKKIWNLCIGLFVVALFTYAPISFANAPMLGDKNTIHRIKLNGGPVMGVVSEVNKRTGTATFKYINTYGKIATKSLPLHGKMSSQAEPLAASQMDGQFINRMNQLESGKKVSAEDLTLLEQVQNRD